MANSFSSLCDDFYLDMYINTELELPAERDTILAFFERVQKQFPTMGNFFRRDDSFFLEEDRRLGQYRWVTLEEDRLGSGIVNPESFADAYQQDILVLQLMPYMLSVNHLDIDCLDVSFGMDFDCFGNHDEVIAEALLATSGFSSLLELPGAKPIGCSPSLVISLSDDMRTQGRISIESKTSMFEPEKEKNTNDESISLSFCVRRYTPTTGKFDPIASFVEQCRIAEELMVEKIIPNFVKPLTSVISQRRLN